MEAPAPGQPRIGIWLFLAVLGIAVRGSMLWFVDYRFDAGDASGYLQAAHNLLEHHIYSFDGGEHPSPSAYRPPLYPGFVALALGVFGDTPIAVQLAQLFLSVMTALLVTRIATTFVPSAAPWVFGAMMLSPFEAVYAGALLSETLTAFLLVATAAAIMLLTGLKRWLVGGILFGLTALTRDIYLPLILGVAATWALVGSDLPRRRMCDAGILLIAACLTVLPWTARNLAATDHLVPVSAGRLGLSLWSSTWATDGEFTKSDATGGRVYPPKAYRNEAERELVARAIALGMNDVESDRIYRTLAVQRMLDEPLAVLGTALVRAPRLWFGTRFDIFKLTEHWFPRGSNSWRVAKAMLWGLNSIFIVLGMIGMVIAWRKRNATLWLVLPIAFTAAVYFPLNSFENRYSQPVYPFVLVFAGIAAEEIAARISPRFRRWLAVRRERRQ